MNQISFDPLDYGESRDAARAARDAFYKDHIAKYGKGSARRWVLKNQLRKYESFGVPDGRVRDVFYVNINHREATA